jgi:microcystin-dependent protein
MPSDANGVYSLPSGYLAITGQTIQASQHNPPLEDIAVAVTGRLAASGANPMTGPVRAADGTVGAPSATFASATNSGFYKTAGGIGVSIGGTKVAEFTAGGIASGARFIGELIPYSGSTAPALAVFPVGQTLLRAAYPDLWAFAQTQIAAGNTLYNNGNGSTTFGIADCRGRAFAFKDNLGGVAAGRLSATTISPDANTIGAAGGAQTQTLAAGQIPVITSNGTVAVTGLSDSGAVVTSPNPTITSLSGAAAGYGFVAVPTIGQIGFTGSGTASVTSNNAGGLAHPNVQPTLIVTCLLFAGA